MSRRLPGATDSERLTLSTIKDSDQLTTRHNPGMLDDVDLGTAKKILQATPVFACTSAAATAAKTAFLQDSFPDFELVNGRTIIVYMANANTAANPTLNVQYTDAIPLDGDYWQAGTFIKCQYVDITVNGNRIRRWVMDQGANNVKAQLNGALAQNLTEYSSSLKIKGELLLQCQNVTVNGGTGQRVSFPQKFTNDKSVCVFITHVNGLYVQSAGTIYMDSVVNIDRNGFDVFLNKNGPCNLRYFAIGY